MLIILEKASTLIIKTRLFLEEHYLIQASEIEQCYVEPYGLQPRETPLFFRIIIYNKPNKINLCEDRVKISGKLDLYRQLKLISGYFVYFQQYFSEYSTFPCYFPFSVNNNYYQDCSDLLLR